ncbi:DUF29 domain-containing protein [Phormidium tenue]|jgi:hypothetical protein|uniref:DUF29 domain-containing protein n=1 Tax=Phormidium tenue FACHB-1050 TaxID=2692857 RepID=A0ABR8CET5_9CYAN|nr:DUF29 domain-containing protein [Phormidium tenue]MBD2319283.1 DUF29 domain-containing protein [Phormidium tenue FACHB-1050]
MTQAITKLSLYDRDQHLWLEEEIAKLRVKDFQGLDLVHLIEELEIVAGRDRAEIESRLGVLLAHLLKRLYVQSEYDYRGWEITIREQRRHLKIALQQSPSLKRFFVEAFDRAWQDALIEVREDYPQVAFPDQWQFSQDVEILLTQRFWE